MRGMKVPKREVNEDTHVQLPLHLLRVNGKKTLMVGVNWRNALMTVDVSAVIQSDMLDNTADALKVVRKVSGLEDCANRATSL